MAAACCANLACKFCARQCREDDPNNWQNAIPSCLLCNLIPDNRSKLVTRQVASYRSRERSSGTSLPVRVAYIQGVNFMSNISINFGYCWRWKRETVRFGARRKAQKIESKKLECKEWGKVYKEHELLFVYFTKVVRIFKKIYNIVNPQNYTLKNYIKLVILTTLIVLALNGFEACIWYKKKIWRSRKFFQGRRAFLVHQHFL